jgi:hypothetical protein
MKNPLIRSAITMVVLAGSIGIVIEASLRLGLRNAQQSDTPPHAPTMGTSTNDSPSHVMPTPAAGQPRAGQESGVPTNGSLVSLLHECERYTQFDSGEERVLRKRLRTFQDRVVEEDLARIALTDCAVRVEDARITFLIEQLHRVPGTAAAEQIHDEAQQEGLLPAQQQRLESAIHDWSRRNTGTRPSPRIRSGDVVKTPPPSATRRLSPSGHDSGEEWSPDKADTPGAAASAPSDDAASRLTPPRRVERPGRQPSPAAVTNL